MTKATNDSRYEIESKIREGVHFPFDNGSEDEEKVHVNKKMEEISVKESTRHQCYEILAHNDFSGNHSEERCYQRYDVLHEMNECVKENERICHIRSHTPKGVSISHVESSPSEILGFVSGLASNFNLLCFVIE